MRGLPSILLLFRNELNACNNTGGHQNYSRIYPCHSIMLPKSVNHTCFIDLMHGVISLTDANAFDHLTSVQKGQL